MKQGLPRVQISMMNVYICVYLTPADLFDVGAGVTLQDAVTEPEAFTTGCSLTTQRPLPQDAVTEPGRLYHRM